MLALLLLLAVLIFGVGIVLKLVGVAVGFVLSLGIVGVILVVGGIIWLVTRSE